MEDIKLVPPQRARLWEPIADSLRMAIINGGLAPGTHLVETELAEKLNVSRLPVRQALEHLEQEHLVVSYPHRGAIVVGLTAEDVKDIYKLRRLVEVHAAREAIPKLKPDELDQLRELARQIVELARREDFESVAERDVQFHRTMVSLAGSKRLLAMWDMLRPVIDALFVITDALHTDLVPDITRKHEAILTALANSDLEAVTAAIDHHIADASGRILAAMGSDANISA